MPKSYVKLKSGNSSINPLKRATALRDVHYIPYTGPRVPQALVHHYYLCQCSLLPLIFRILSLVFYFMLRYFSATTSSYVRKYAQATVVYCCTVSS